MNLTNSNSGLGDEGLLPRVAAVHFLAQAPQKNGNIDVPETFTWDQTADLVVVTDHKLGFGGELIEYVKGCNPIFKRITQIPAGQEDSILSQYSKAELWQSYTIQSPKSGVK